MFRRLANPVVVDGRNLFDPQIMESGRRRLPLDRPARAGTGRMILVYSLFGLALFCLVHVFADRMRFLDGTPRSRWLSAAGGISLAYVFLHFLPEPRAEGQRLVREGEGGAVAMPFIEFELYGLALVGLLAYYGAERYVQTEKRRGDVRMRSDTHSTAADEGQGRPRARFITGSTSSRSRFTTSCRATCSCAAARRTTKASAEHGVRGGPCGGGKRKRVPRSLFQEAEISLVTFAVALAIHFLVTDYGLREDFREGYMKLGRWVLCGAAILGWLLGVFVALPEIAVIAIMALLGGGIILNVLKEELPAERQSRFGALIAGAAGYAVLLALAH